MTKEEIADTAAQVAANVAEAARTVAEEAASAALMVAEEQNANIRAQSEIIAQLSESVATIATSVDKLANAVADRPTKNDVGRKLVGAMGLVIVIGVFFTGLTFWSIYGLQRTSVANQRTLIECLIPGPDTPTEGQPGTGNNCFDATAERVDERVSGIKDTNRNSVDDNLEILDILNHLRSGSDLTRQGIERLEKAHQ